MAWTMRSVTAPGITAALLLLATVAHAHPLVEQARGQYVAAEFEAALETIRQAESAGDLVRADVLRLLETQALVYAALGDPGGVDRALTAIASIHPGHDLAPEVPPELRSRYAALERELAGVLRVEVEPSRTAESAVLEARVAGDPAHVTREVRVHARAGDAEWETAVDRPLVLEVASSDAVDYWADAVGPGGATLATRGTADDPLTLAPGASTRPGEDGGGVPLLVWIAGGAAVALAIIAGIVLFTAGDDTVITQPGAPMVPPTM
jgi:hypothetical protein